jgi:hypothetical protein
VSAWPLLQGSYDLHVHCAPDIVPRAQDMLELAQAADKAAMAGILIKDHTNSTASVAHLLNKLYPRGPRFFGALALNPTVGGLNPLAVEAALRSGARVIYFPTYGAAHQIAVKGKSGFPAAFSLLPGFAGITALDGSGRLKPEVIAILGLIAEFDAVLATGHLSPREIRALLSEARARCVRRMLVTHASELVPGISIAEQQNAVEQGALIEHCLLAAATGETLIAEIARQIRAVGVQNVIVSSDLGKAQFGPVIPAFAHYLEELQRCGFSDAEMRVMILENPKRLIEKAI